MVIFLAFSINREVLSFKIEDKVITYYDRKWKNGVNFMPKDKDLVKKLLYCRNKIPYSNKIMQWIQEANSGDNLKQYKAAKTDEDLAKIITLDAKSKGLVPIKPKK
jgi:hypothetical protein